MKKLISILVMLAICLVPSFSAFAQSSAVTEDNCFITDAEFESLEHTDLINEISIASTQLIKNKALSIAKSGINLILKGETKCTVDVVKCGFTYIKIQQHKNGNWVDYKTYNDLYSNSNVYSTTKSILVSSGYKYRAVGQHYAKKSLLSTEKIKSTTSSLSF